MQMIHNCICCVCKHGGILFKIGMQVSMGYGIIGNANKVTGKSKNKKKSFWKLIGFKSESTTNFSRLMTILKINVALRTLCVCGCMHAFVHHIIMTFIWFSLCWWKYWLFSYYIFLSAGGKVHRTSFLLITVFYTFFVGRIKYFFLEVMCRCAVNQRPS
jgi:hypothetical protein